MEALHLKVENSGPELILRQGSARDVQYKDQSFSGSITAPVDYAVFKTDDAHIKKDRALFIADINDGSIEFLSNVDENNTSNIKVIGRLNLISAIKELGINTGKKYSNSTLAQALKMNRILFADKEACMVLVSNLQTFHASVTKELTDANDNKGNVNKIYQQAINHGYTLEFTLATPIFIGEESHKFKVEILYDIRDKQIEFWLESVELAEIMQEAKTTIIAREMERVKELWRIIYK